MTEPWRVGKTIPINVYNASLAQSKVWAAGDTIPQDAITAFDVLGFKWKRCIQGWGTTQAEPILLELFGPLWEE